MSERLNIIRKENAEFEKESPYNFCDRWCERCQHEKQIRCRLYLDDFECRATCIAYGRDENDAEITAKVMEKQLDEVEEAMEKLSEETDIDFEDLEPDRRNHNQFVEDNSLDATAKIYLDKAHAFLKDTFYENKPADPDIQYDFETVSWYHMFLQVKLQRALSGFHEPASDDDYAMHDAVAQFEIAKKSAGESIKALRNIKGHFPGHRVQITALIALLHNIDCRIDALLETI